GAARSVGNTPERSCRPGYRGGVRPTAPRALRDSGIRLLATDFTVRVQPMTKDTQRSEEHTSELQSLTNLVCRLLLEKKKEITFEATTGTNVADAPIHADGSVAPRRHRAITVYEPTSKYSATSHTADRACCNCPKINS